jgi:hypothetical protein
LVTRFQQRRRNPSHWIQLKCGVEGEEHETAPGGERVTKQLDQVQRKIGAL